MEHLLKYLQRQNGKTTDKYFEVCYEAWIGAKGEKNIKVYRMTNSNDWIYYENGQSFFVSALIIKGHNTSDAHFAIMRKISGKKLYFEYKYRV